MRLTSKGQVTIPMAMREKLGLLPNTEVEFELERDSIRIRKARSRGTGPRGRALIEHMRGRGSLSLSTDDIMKLTRG